jgi:hypothetical protein
MSATNRGAVRNPNDYYITPLWAVSKFLAALHEDNLVFPNGGPELILDPCAGGDADHHHMTYPTAIAAFKPWSPCHVDTMDIREDSRAEVKGSYLDYKLEYQPDLVISNPPFIHAVDFVNKGLRDVRDRGWVSMLLRLNFMGSQERQPWWEAHMPVYGYTFSKRLSFTTPKSDELAAELAAAKGKKFKKGGTDNCEYAQFLWQRGNKPRFVQMRVI